MPQERLSKRKIREILWMKEAGLSNRAIASSYKISNSTVEDYLRRIQAADLHWPLAEAISEEVLWSNLFPEGAAAVEPVRPLPDWEEIQKELSKKGVTLKLLWIEYHEKHLDGYAYTQYCEYYRQVPNVQSPKA
jgi:transposase